VIRRPSDHSHFLRRGELADEEASERLEAAAPEAALRRRDFLGRTAALAGGASLASILPADALVSAAARATRYPLPSPSEMPLDTFVVLMMENRSFDHYFGWHPEADAKNAGLTYPDAEGKMLETFHLGENTQGCQWRDPSHSWKGGRWQWNKGRNDRFVTGDPELDGSDEFAIGYYLKEDLPFIPHVADAYTLYDRWFCSIMGPTWPNRHYQWGATCGGEKGNGDVEEAIPAGGGEGLYTWETIDNRATANGVSFRYYYSDLPFGGVYGRDTVLNMAPIAQFYADAEAGTLPNICIVDPPFRDGGGGDGLSADEHPHGDIRLGQAFMSDVAHAFIESPQYRRGAMFIDYDEWGGFFDHVKPRFVPDERRSSDIQEDFGMTGFRIPGVAISPFTRGGGVSHMPVTHESILKLISYRYRLGYLTKRHRYATNIGRSFDFSRKDFDPPDLPHPAAVAATPCRAQGGEGGERGMEAPHGEMAELETSGYLESIGAEVYDGTPEQIFREPSSVRQALATGDRAG
jgi:phospholipase C